MNSREKHLDSTSSGDNTSYSTCSLGSALSLSTEFIKPAAATAAAFDTEPNETSNLLLFSTIQTEREFDNALNTKNKSLFRFSSTSTRKSNSEMTYHYQFESIKNLPNDENLFEEESLIESSDCKEINKMSEHFQSTLLSNKSSNIVETIDPTYKPCKKTIQLSAKFESDNKSQLTGSNSKSKIIFILKNFIYYLNT